MEREAALELQITQVERQKRHKHRYNIFVNGEFSFAVHEDLLVKYRLLKGETIDDIDLAAIIAEDEKHRAYLDALQMIGRRPRSTKEVKVKLQHKGYEMPMIDQVTAQLQEQGYIDDGQFAKLWTEQRIYSQKKGRRWVQMELSQKGLSKESISEAMGAINSEDELQMATEVARKKWGTESGEEWDKRRRLTAFLLRRGYPNDIVKQAIKQVTGEALDEFE
jgi:regulatory protein